MTKNDLSLTRKTGGITTLEIHNSLMRDLMSVAGSFSRRWVLPLEDKKTPCIVQVDTRPKFVRVEISEPQVSASFIFHDESLANLEEGRIRDTVLDRDLEISIHNNGTRHAMTNVPEIAARSTSLRLIGSTVMQRSKPSFNVIWDEVALRTGHFLPSPTVRNPYEWRAMQSLRDKGSMHSYDTGSIRKKPKPSRYDTRSAVRITIKPDAFRNLLNQSSKHGIFSIAADRGMFAIFNGRNPNSVERFPKLHKKYKLSSVVDGQGSAGIYHKVLYDTLYRRKEGLAGIINHMASHHPTGEGEPEFSFGLSKDNRVFVQLSYENCSCRILFQNIYEAPALRDLPELTVLGKTRGTKKVVKTPATKPTELSLEDEALIGSWKTSSDSYRDARKAERIEDRKLMFNDHILVLAMSGRGPTEEELDLLQRL